MRRKPDGQVISVLLTSKCVILEGIIHRFFFLTGSFKICLAIMIICPKADVVLCIAHSAGLNVTHVQFAAFVNTKRRLHLTGNKD